MKPATPWQEKQNCVQNAMGWIFTFAVTPDQGSCVIPPPRTVLEKKEHSCSSLLLTPVKLELGMRVRGSEPRTLTDIGKLSETHQQLFILHFWGGNRGTEEWTRHFSSFPALHLLAPGPWEIIQSDPILLGRAEDKAQPVSPSRAWREGRLHWPIGPKITLELRESYNSGQSFKTCLFSNVNNTKMFQ